MVMIYNEVNYISGGKILGNWESMPRVGAGKTSGRAWEYRLCEKKSRHGIFWGGGKRRNHKKRVIMESLLFFFWYMFMFLKRLLLLLFRLLAACCLLALCFRCCCIGLLIFFSFLFLFNCFVTIALLIDRFHILPYLT